MGVTILLWEKHILAILVHCDSQSAIEFRDNNNIYNGNLFTAENYIKPSDK